jgi:hypothetical protein
MDEHKLHDKDKAFIVKDGTKLHSIKDLYGHLAIIADDAFTHHVSEEKNDFASWIEHAHQDKFLAQAIRRGATKEEMRKTIFIAMFR